MTESLDGDSPITAPGEGAVSGSLNPPSPPPPPPVHAAPPASPTDGAYNVVTDTVTGVNVRWSDNKFQAVFVLISAALATLAGSLLAGLNPQWEMSWRSGAMIGLIVGLVLGVFASGICLMVYRTVRHLSGKHD
jgi:hypothetical protein